MTLSWLPTMIFSTQSGLFIELNCVGIIAPRQFTSQFYDNFIQFNLLLLVAGQNLGPCLIGANNDKDPKPHLLTPANDPELYRTLVNHVYCLRNGWV